MDSEKLHALAIEVQNAEAGLRLAAEARAAAHRMAVKANQEHTNEKGLLQAKWAPIFTEVNAQSELAIVKEAKAKTKLEVAKAALHEFIGPDKEPKSAV